MTLSLPTALDAKAFHHRGLTAASPVMRRLFVLLAQVERSRASVLVAGERGVGKARIARAIAEAAGASAPLVVLEASSDVDGAMIAEAFARASGGTLVVREVSALPLEAQESLHRLLAVHVARVRVVSTTSASLEDEVGKGRFLEGLYDELATIRLFVPPLRHRPEDVIVLARLFAGELGGRALPPGVVADLAARSWVGNVEELRQTVTALVTERAARESGVVPAPEGEPLADDDLGLDGALEGMVDLDLSYAELKERVCARFARVYLATLIQHTRGNRTEAARIAGLDRTYLGRMLVRLDVPVPVSR